MVAFALPPVVGIMDAVGGLVSIAGSVILLLMLIGLGGFAYKSLRGDGIRWPDENAEEQSDDEVQRGDDDDEWKYY